MDWVYNLSGIATPLIRKFQAGEAMSVAGVPVLVGGDNDYGLKLASTIAAVHCVGVTVDTAAVVTAQQSDGTDTARVIAVVCNPDAVFRAPLSGGAASGVALTEGTAATADTAGDDVDTDVDYSSPSMDNGCLVGTSGANKGVVRPITALTAANADCTHVFPYDIAVGDKFIALPWKFSGGGPQDVMALSLQYVQLGTTLEVVDASVAVDTDNANFIPLRLVLPPALVDVTRQSFIELKIYDHHYAAIA